MAEKKYLDYDGLTEVVSKSKESFQKKEFLGTKEEWEALPSADKVKYNIVNLTNDTESAYSVVDVVENNNMHAVTSNAVYGQVYHKMGGLGQSSVTDVDVFTIFENYAQANRWVFGNFPFSGTCTNLPGGAAAMNTYCWMYKSGGGTMKVRLMDCYTHNEWVTQKVGGVWSAWEKTVTGTQLDAKVTLAEASFVGSNIDFFSVMDGLDLFKTTLVRVVTDSGTHTPDGFSDVDFHLYVSRLDANYTRTVAYNIRNNTVYVISKVAGVWGSWEKLITSADFNDWERVTITMESGYTNGMGTPDVYWSPSRKQLYISKLDAVPPSDWVGGTPFCRFTRPSGFNYNVWGLGFFANIYWPSGAFYPISCGIWANPNDGNDLGFVLNSIDIAPGEHSISNLSVRILGVVLQGT